MGWLLVGGFDGFECIRCRSSDEGRGLRVRVRLSFEDEVESIGERDVEFKVRGG